MIIESHFHPPHPPGLQHWKWGFGAQTLPHPSVRLCAEAARAKIAFLVGMIPCHFDGFCYLFLFLSIWWEGTAWRIFNLVLLNACRGCRGIRIWLCLVCFRFVVAGFYMQLNHIYSGVEVCDGLTLLVDHFMHLSCTINVKFSSIRTISYLVIKSMSANFVPRNIFWCCLPCLFIERYDQLVFVRFIVSKCPASRNHNRFGSNRTPGGFYYSCVGLNCVL